MAADLFCGAGGTSTGMLHACQDMGLELDLIAINHWPIAISTHQANHPYAKTLCENLDQVDPRKLVPSGRLNLLVASPECTHHSNARGGRPMNDQSRASAWTVCRWAEALYIDNLIIENVKEFRSWGPLGAIGRPIKRLRGQLYFNFLDALRALGYRVEDRIINCADYGDPTTRERLFIIARRGHKQIIWPKKTHCDPAKIQKRNGGLFPDTLKPWVPARDVIDWTIPGKSIFGRKKALAKKTLERIYAGLKKFGGPNAEPFLIVLRQHMDAVSLDKPMPTITASAKHVALVQPVIVNMKGKSKSRSVEEPLPTQTTNSHLYVAEPFLLPHNVFDQSQADSIDRPMRTLVGKNARQVRLVEPIIVPRAPNADVQSTDAPLGTTIPLNGAGLVEPVSFLVDINHGRSDSESAEKEAKRRVQNLDLPLPAVTTKRGKGIVQSFMLNIDHRGTKGSSCRSIDVPVATQTTKARTAVVEPCIVKFNGTATAQSVHEPLHTVATHERFALVTTEHGTYALDIRLRMLRPHELAAAMSLRNYKFNGKLDEQVRQIGNAVPAKTAQALITEVLQ